MSKFNGKRMVSEDLIKKIGQGGGGTTYTAGDNITIKNDVISATDTTYTSGSGIYIQSDGNAIELDYNDTTTVGVEIDENDRATWNVKLAEDGGITTDIDGLKVDTDVVALKSDIPGAKTELVIGNKNYMIQQSDSVQDLIDAGVPYIQGQQIYVDNNGNTELLYDASTDADTKELYFDGYVVYMDNSGTSFLFVNSYTSQDFNDHTFRTKVNVNSLTNSGFTILGNIRYQIDTNTYNFYIYGCASSLRGQYVTFQQNARNYSIPYISSQVIPIVEIGNKVDTNTASGTVEPSLYNRFIAKPNSSMTDGLYFVGTSVNTFKGYLEYKSVDEIELYLGIPRSATSTSVVTPTTETLTFTYSDNTTGTITFLTAATVSTTTTLS